MPVRPLASEKCSSICPEKKKLHKTHSNGRRSWLIKQLTSKLWCSFVFLQITPCYLVLKLKIEKNIPLERGSRGLICKKTK